MIRLFLVFCLALGAAPAAAGQSADGPVREGTDEAFLRELALASLAQMELGYDALERSRREDVRGLALEVVNTHGPLLKALTTAARERRVAIPKSLEDHPEYAVERPWEDGEVDFDRAFLGVQVRMNERILDILDREGAGGADERLRAFAWESQAEYRARGESARLLLETLEREAVEY